MLVALNFVMKVVKSELAGHSEILVSKKNGLWLERYLWATMRLIFYYLHPPILALLLTSNLRYKNFLELHLQICRWKFLLCVKKLIISYKVKIFYYLERLVDFKGYISIACERFLLIWTWKFTEDVRKI